MDQTLLWSCNSLVVGVVQKEVFHLGGWRRRVGGRIGGRRGAVLGLFRLRLRGGGAGGDCIKIGLQGKSILRDYFQENRTSQRPFLLLRISFPGRPIYIQFVPESFPGGTGPACGALPGGAADSRTTLLPSTLALKESANWELELRMSQLWHGRVGEDTFEIYLRYRYRYMWGCIFCIFRYFRYRYH